MLPLAGRISFSLLVAFPFPCWLHLLFLAICFPVRAGPGCSGILGFWGSAALGPSRDVLVAIAFLCYLVFHPYRPGMLWDSVVLRVWGSEAVLENSGILGRWARGILGLDVWFIYLLPLLPRAGRISFSLAGRISFPLLVAFASPCYLISRPCRRGMLWYSNIPGLCGSGAVPRCSKILGRCGPGTLGLEAWFPYLLPLLFPASRASFSLLVAYAFPYWLQLFSLAV